MNFIKTILLCYLFTSFTHEGINSMHSHSINTPMVTEWMLSDFAQSTNKNICIQGTPKIIECKYGNALEFNGKNDGIFIKSMPLKNLSTFTIEAIFKPYSNGNFEQRFFHCGKIRGNRVLLETRSTKTDWYFDAYIKSKEKGCTLIDSTLLHPLNEWYHIAYTVDNGKLTTFINGQKELEGQINFLPLTHGTTSLGVRQNKLSWFKGVIYKIKITPKVLQPNNFMKY